MVKRVLVGDEGLFKMMIQGSELQYSFIVVGLFSLEYFLREEIFGLVVVQG